MRLLDDSSSQRIYACKLGLETIATGTQLVKASNWIADGDVSNSRYFFPWDFSL